MELDIQAIIITNNKKIQIKKYLMKYVIYIELTLMINEHFNINSI